MKRTPLQRAEMELTKAGLALPETDAAPGWKATRCLRVRGRMFCIFGEPADMPGHKGNRDAQGLTIVVKLPVSAEMAEQLYFVREGSSWYTKHNWVIAHFDPEDDILAEMDTLKAWLIQSYCAMAPKKLARLVQAVP